MGCDEDAATVFCVELIQFCVSRFWSAATHTTVTCVYCDGCEPSMRNLVERIGYRTLLFASDFPHESNMERAMREIEELAERDDLSPETKQAIFCDNIEAFYGR